MNYPNLHAIVQHKEGTNLEDNDEPELISEVQGVLKVPVTRQADTATLDALANFKKQAYLEYPSVVGYSTAVALLELVKRPEPPSKEHTQAAPANKSHVLMLYPGYSVVLSHPILPGGNLTWAEFTHNGQRVPNDYQLVENSKYIAEVFQQVRDAYGSPIQVNSGYRSPAVNKAVGGSSKSYHMQALALDIIAPDFERLVECAKENSVATGIGISNSHFVHIDSRPGINRVIFPYS